MACKNYWWVTRPKRKLILIPDLIKIFSATATGKTWHRNRELQKQFERNLTNAKWKAQNNSNDGSGGRTYAALLAQLGLWYTDESNLVGITLAGQEIINGNNPIPIITKQLLDLQFPSSYSIKPQVNVCREFQLQPYRFIMKLFLDNQIDELSQEEISFCLVPYIKKNADTDLCLNLLHKYDHNKTEVITNAKNLTGLQKTSLLNIGNTIVNNFEYTGYFEEAEDIKKLKIKKSKIDEAKKFINDLRTGLIQNPENEPVYQRRYGTGLDKTKDYSTSIRTPMPINPNERKIIECFYVISSSEPVYRINNNLITRISKQTGASTRLIQSVIEKLPVETQPNQFAEAYLQLATGGRSTATDFELKTTALFNEGFDINAKWIGNHKRYPDIIVFIDKKNKKHGIIDTKAYREYNLPLDHKNRMAHVYIPDLSTFKFEGENYSIAFFGYVAGGFTNNIENSFSELVSMTETPGYLITAQHLLDLLKIYKDKLITSVDLMKLFSCNTQIVPYEFITQSN